MANSIGRQQPQAVWSKAAGKLQALATAPTRVVHGLAQLRGVAVMKARAANQALGQQWHQTAVPSSIPPASSGLSHDAALRRAAQQRIKLEGLKPLDLPESMRSAYLRGQQAQSPARFTQNARAALSESQGDLTSLHPSQRRHLLSQASKASTRLARGHAQGSAAQNAGQLEEDRLKGQAIADFRTAVRVATMGASESAIATRKAAGEGRWLAAAGQGLKGAVQTAMAATSAPGLGLLARGGLGLVRAGVSGAFAAARNPALIARVTGSGLRAAGGALPRVPGLVARAPGAAWNAASQAPAAVTAAASNTWNAGRVALATGVTGTQVVQGMAVAGNTVDTGLTAGRAVSKGAAGNWSGALIDGIAVTLSVVPGLRGAPAEARAARNEALEGAGVRRMIGDNELQHLTAAQTDPTGGAFAARMSWEEALAQRRISARIDRACASADEGIKLEGQAAQAIRQDVIGFQRKIANPASGKDLGEIDIETAQALVEVTKRTGDKTGQIATYLGPIMNPDSKSVILYGPSYTKAAVGHLESQGFFERGLVIVAKTEEQLQRAVDITTAFPRKVD